jgi:anti-sigma factor RsiW
MSEREPKEMTEELPEPAGLAELERAVAYHAGHLDAAARAEFEVHLATCAACQQTLAEMKQLMPKLGSLESAVPGFTPKRTVEEQVARFDRMVAAERRQRLFRRVAVVAVAAAVAIGGVAAFKVLTHHKPPRQQLFAPTK